MDFEPGKRYPFGEEDFKPIAPYLWPAVRGAPDFTRGRRFIKDPCDWEFWLLDGKKVIMSYSMHGFIASCSSEPDPDLPEPLDVSAPKQKKRGG